MVTLYKAGACVCALPFVDMKIITVLVMPYRPGQTPNSMAQLASRCQQTVVHNHKSSRSYEVIALRPERLAQ